MLYLIGGDNSYLSSQRVDELKKEFLQRYNGSISIFNADEIDSCAEIVQDADSLSLFSKEKLIIIKRLFSSSKSLIDDLSEFLQKADKVNIIIWEDNPPDKRRSIYRLIQKKGIIEEFTKLSPTQLKSWVSGQLQTRVKFDPECVDILILKVGEDQIQLASIIDNLVHLIKANRGKKLTVNDIHMFVAKTTEESIWEFVDAIGTREKKTALEIIESLLREQQDFPFIISMISRQFRIIALIKYLQSIGKNYAEIIQILKLHPFVIRKGTVHTKNFSLHQLKKLYKKLVKTDLVVKQGRFDGKLALNLFIAAL